MNNGMRYLRDKKGQKVLKIIRLWQKTQLSEKDDMRKEPMVWYIRGMKNLAKEYSNGDRRTYRE